MSRTRLGGTPLLLLVCTLAAGPETASAQATLPSGWTSTDVGNPAVAGGASHESGTITVRGAGVDVWDTSDEFHVVYLQIPGDIDIRVQVTDVEDVHVWTKAGLMIRESLAGDAPYAFMLAHPQRGLAFQWRTTAGTHAAHSEGTGDTAPVWLRLIRRGDMFQGYSSADGVSWIPAGSAAIAMSASVYVGLAVTSHDATTPATATFTNLDLGSALAPPWASVDVGNPALAGSASVTGGTFTVTGAGVDIWDAWDQFRLVYQPVTGDAEIVARLGSLERADEWSKAGVMIRESLTGSAAHAYMMASAANGWAFQRRVWAGWMSDHTPGSGGAAPGWVRLVRRGDVFSAYESPDGSAWRLVGTETIAMSPTVYVGLAVTSHNPGAWATASFTDVAIQSPAGGNEPPNVTITSPHAGASFTAPADVTVTAAADDPDGTLTRVDFALDGAVVASVSAHPYSVTLRDLQAGFYTLTAVAYDDVGASRTSAAVSISVVPGASQPALPLPATLLFVPSADHATNVDYYTVEIRRAGDGLSASPVAAQTLGKPRIENGEISLDVSTLVNALSAGSYYAVVVATGPGGSTVSTNLAWFER